MKTKKQIMMKRGSFLYIAILAASIQSCSTFDYHEDVLQSANTDLATRSIDISKKEIIPLAANSDSVNNYATAKNMDRFIDNTLSNNLYAIREMPFKLKSASNGRYMTVEEAGREVKLTSFTGTNTPSNEMLFYVKVYPASSGIPYMIYSHHTNTPLAVGYYPGAENTKVLFAKADDSGDKYSSVWDIFPATIDFRTSKSNGAVVIESQSYISQGSGGTWDVYNNVLKVKDYNTISYSKYTNQSDQEFIIEPEGTFYIESVEYIDNSNLKLTKLDDFKSEITKENTKYDEVYEEFEFMNVGYEPCSFNENKNVNFKLNNSQKLFRPTVSKEKKAVLYRKDEVGIYYIGKNENVGTFLNSKIAATLPPRTKVTCEIAYEKFNLEVEYRVTANCNGRRIQLVGKWSGTCFTKNYSYTLKRINLDTRLMTTEYFPSNTNK